MLSGGNDISGSNFIESLSAAQLAAAEAAVKIAIAEQLSAGSISIPSFGSLSASGMSLSSLLSSMGSDVSALAEELREADAALGRRIDETSSSLAEDISLSVASVESELALSVQSIEHSAAETELSIRTDMQTSADVLEEKIASTKQDLQSLADDLHGNYYTAEQADLISSALSAGLVGSASSTSADNDILGVKKYAD